MSKICGNCSVEKQTTEYRKIKEKRTKTVSEYLQKIMQDPAEKIKRNMKSLISVKLRNQKSRHTKDYLGADMKVIIS
jgi:hypothetical protein